MIASNGKDERAPVSATLARLNAAVPTLVQRLDERLFASHVRDVVAVAQAYLAGELPWAALLTGLEAALLQARACMVDDQAGEALVEAAEAVARYAGAALGRTGGDAPPPETPTEPPVPPATPTEAPGAPATSRAAPLPPVMASQAPVPPGAPSAAPAPPVMSSAAPSPLVMSSAAQRSRDICPRPQDASGSQPDPSTALGVTTKASPASVVSNEAPVPPGASNAAPDQDTERPDSPGTPASGTGFANTKSFPEDESLKEKTETEITNTYEPGGLAS